MNSNRFTIENFIAAAVFLLAVVVRFIYLGSMPLSDGEALWALQAHALADGAVGDIGPQPGYINLTGLSLLLFGSNDFTARLWPAIAGSLIVLVPLFFRRLLGSAGALVLMIALAVEPALVAASRMAGSPAMGLGFGLLALGLAYHRQRYLAGVALGLALLSGPGILVAALALLLAWVVERLLPGKPATQSGDMPDEDQIPQPVNWREWLPMLVTTGATVLLVGTLFFYLPRGLAAWVSGLPAYLQGWLQPSGIPALRMAAALLVYQPLALILGGVGAARGWLRGDRLSRLLSLWFLVSFVFILLYPSRQVIDLVWVLPSLWALAAVELAHDLRAPHASRLASLCLAGIIILLLALFWINLMGSRFAMIGTESMLLRLAVLLGLLALIAVAAAVVSLGWTWDTARLGLVWGACAVFLVYGISVMWGASFRHEPGQIDLWRPVPQVQNADLFMATVEDLSQWNTGLSGTIDLALAVDSPSLRWALRNYPALITLPEDQLASLQNAPSIVIARQAASTPALTQAYRGQDFAWWVYPGWQGALPPDFINWLTTRQAPLYQEQVLLWARSDLFPGSESIPSASPLDLPGLEGQEQE